MTAKMELVSMTGKLMPNGNPDFKSVIHYPRINAMINQYGRKTMLKVLVLMVKDFSASLNVVRNMNEDQMIECAAMLLDECDNFRLEDYMMMFTLAKRGRLELNNGKGIMDRVDIDTIAKIFTAYHDLRSDAGMRIQEEMFQEDEKKYRELPPVPETPEEKEMSERFGKLLGVMTAYQSDLQEDKIIEEKKKSDKRRQDDIKYKEWIDSLAPPETE